MANKKIYHYMRLAEKALNKLSMISEELGGANQKDKETLKELSLEIDNYTEKTIYVQEMRS